MAQAQFALAQGRISNEVLDYSSNEGIKLYCKNKATTFIETKYDLDTGLLYSFLQKVRNYTMNQNWAFICMIPVPPTNATSGQVWAWKDIEPPTGSPHMNKTVEGKAYN
jgi:hypothetical protein